MPLPRHVRKLGNKRAMVVKIQKNKFMSFSTPLKLSGDITALEITHARKAASKHSTALRYVCDHDKTNEHILSNFAHRRKLVAEHVPAIKLFNPTVSVKLATSEEAPAQMTIHRTHTLP